MTAPREIPLDTGTYIETLEEELVATGNRVRIYRTQVKQLERLVERYRAQFGDIDKSEQPDTQTAAADA